MHKIYPLIDGTTQLELKVGGLINEQTTCSFTCTFNGALYDYFSSLPILLMHTTAVNLLCFRFLKSI
jgi:hypothetical protein